MSNFTAEIFLWTILLVGLNENVWNYSIKRDALDWQSIKKNDAFEIFNSSNTLYLFLYIQLVF